MESKLNHSSIEAYSTAYAKKVSSDFFRNHEVIKGKQIVELCNIKQINLFVIKILFQKWKKETEKLQSPYFDYSDKEVVTALASFMNVLSQNIFIKRPHFEPLLKKAVHETILLIFSPFDFYSREINNPEKSRVSLDDLQEIANYVRINPYLIQTLISRFKEKAIKEVFNDEGYSMLTEVYEELKEEQLDDFKEYIDKFSEILPLTMDMIYEEAVPENTDEDFGMLKTKKSVEEEKVVSTNFFNQHLTLNEKLNVNAVPKPNLADMHQKKKIDNIKKHISIYQKFMFINELFNGKVEEFDNAVVILEDCKDYQEALSVINAKYKQKFEWNMEAEEVSEFLEILSKRFN